MDVDIEKEELQAAVIALSEALDAVKTEKTMASASETIDYGSSDYLVDVERISDSLKGIRIADLKALYRKPFFTTLRKDYTRAVVAGACMQIVADAGEEPSKVWVQIKAAQGKLTGDLYD